MSNFLKKKIAIFLLLLFIFPLNIAADETLGQDLFDLEYRVTITPVYDQSISGINIWLFSWEFEYKQLDLLAPNYEEITINFEYQTSTNEARFSQKLVLDDNNESVTGNTRVLMNEADSHQQITCWLQWGNSKMNLQLFVESKSETRNDMEDIDITAVDSIHTTEIDGQPNDTDEGTLNMATKPESLGVPMTDKPDADENSQSILSGESIFSSDDPMSYYYLDLFEAPMLHKPILMLDIVKAVILPRKGGMIKSSDSRETLIPTARQTETSFMPPPHPASFFIDEQPLLELDDNLFNLSELALAHQTPTLNPTQEEEELSASVTAPIGGMNQYDLLPPKQTENTLSNDGLPTTGPSDDNTEEHDTKGQANFGRQILGFFVEFWLYLIGLLLLSACLFLFTLYIRPRFRKDLHLLAEFNNSFPQDDLQGVDIPLAAWKHKPLSLLDLWIIGVFPPLSGVDQTVYQKMKFVPSHGGLQVTGYHDYGLEIVCHSKSKKRSNKTQNKRNTDKLFLGQNLIIRFGDETDRQELLLDLSTK